MNDQEIQNMLDEYAALLEQDFIDAIQTASDEIQAYLEENYPADNDQLPDGNNLEEIALNGLETQLSRDFETNLTALSDKSIYRVVVIFALVKNILNINTFAQKNSIRIEIKNIIEDSTNFNANSKRQFFDTFGLTQKQAENITNYRKELNRIFASKNPEALNWKTLKNLSASQRNSAIYHAETGLKESQIDSLVKKQRQALLRVRAKAIGNTLSTKIYHHAQQLAIDAAIRLNLINPEQFKKFWITKRDEKVRHNHAITESLNISGIDLDKPFDSPFGAVFSPPLEINCRCHVAIRKV